MALFNDPLYAQQWHFKLLGNIQKIWSEYSGQGIKVGVYDDGLQYTHPDLNGNYSASLRFHQGSTVYDPLPNVLTGANPEAHGTSVAGIIAGEANNGIGGVGVAFHATLGGVAMLGDTRLQSEATSLAAYRFANTFDVMSNSWGYTPTFSPFQNASTLGSVSSGIIAAYDYVVHTGRGGLGTVIVQAAGNDHSNANADGLNTARQLISVAALTQDGSAQDYSNYGANILIAAGAAAVTTDLQGSAGYNNLAGTNGNYAFDFGGTSAATPVVSGVVALMLDANPNLGWRDVKEILANSAKMTGKIAGGDGSFETSGTSFQKIDRTTVSGLQRVGDSWNDGGRAVSWDYGFGRADAFAAVRMAEVWSVMHSGAHTSANEMHLHGTDAGAYGISYGAGSGSAAATITVGSHMAIENISVTLGMLYTSPVQETQQLTVTLIGPGGASIKLARGSELYYSDVSAGLTWKYGVSQALGLDAYGTWKVMVTDATGAAAGNSGILGDVALDFYGAAYSLNNIHHVTQDFLLAHARNGGGLRDKAINDTNGGVDWLDMATLSGNVVVSLAAGAGFSVGGVAWGKIATNTILENVATGDGADKITGNSLANKIYAMRGNDLVNGGAGNDMINGGAGNDQLNGSTGNDSLFGSSGNDTIFGSSGNDQLNGGAGSDRLDGSTGMDSVAGGDGADVFVFRDGNGVDVVSDFQNNVDTLQIDDLVWGGDLSVAEVLRDYASVVAGAVELDFGAGNILLILHLTSISALQDDITLI